MMDNLFSVSSIAFYLLIILITYIIGITFLKKMGYSTKRANVSYLLALIGVILGVWIGYYCIKHP